MLASSSSRSTHQRNKCAFVEVRGMVRAEGFIGAVPSDQTCILESLSFLNRVFVTAIHLSALLGGLVFLHRGGSGLTHLCSWSISRVLKYKIFRVPYLGFPASSSFHI